MCLAQVVGQITGGLLCSVDPRVWLLDEVVRCLRRRTSVVQVSAVDVTGTYVGVESVFGTHDLEGMLID